ncbi:hypothetical protein KY289_011570 [Solanum tuberosum]|nr:hypothetical protein KY289_011570 [Solanum tuberosum]
MMWFAHPPRPSTNQSPMHLQSLLGCETYFINYVTVLKTQTIYCDNVGVTYLSHNPVFHTRMKHVAVDFAYVRDQVQANRVQVSHTHACDQLVDTFTKPLPKSAFT